MVLFIHDDDDERECVLVRDICAFSNIFEKYA